MNKQIKVKCFYALAIMFLFEEFIQYLPLICPHLDREKERQFIIYKLLPWLFLSVTHAKTHLYAVRVADHYRCTSV